MNFVWLDINASWSHSSLALPAMEANLSPETSRKCGMKAVRGTIKSSISEITEQLSDLEPTYIFATAWLFNVNYLMEVLGRIHAISHPLGIFMGGPEFLGDNGHFLRSHPYVTAVFKGEGEDMFQDFITSLLAQDGRWRSIEGFEYMENGICHTSKAITVRNFPALKYPEESRLFSWNKSFVQLETSRGCFNTCRFCVSGIEKQAVNEVSIADLRKRLQNIAAHGIRQVRVLDRTFNARPKRGVELLELFKEFAGKINFHIEIHPALLRSPFKEEIRNVPAGLLHVEAGIQTLQQYVLDNCARIGDCASAVEGLVYLIGIKKFEVHADLIAGLPGYRYKDLVQDTADLMKLAPGEIQLESLKLLPGTYFRIHSGELGLDYSPVTPYEVLQTRETTHKELNKSMVLSKIIDFWYNDVKWRSVFREIFSSNTVMLEQLVEELKDTDYVTQPLSLETKGVLLYRFCKKHLPQEVDKLALEWVKNGLSIKKEPAENLVKWDYKGSPLPNPIFVEHDSRYKYYYIRIGGKRHWFSFNKEIERIAPVRHFIENVK